ncbi:unnamed protein product [Rotaria sp. Silwood2]|nr:unnamed protein product [Rotaria sp. Silwood2]
MDGTIHTASVNGLSSTVVPITNHKKNSNETITYDDRIDTGNETDNADSQSTNRKICRYKYSASIANIPIIDPMTVDQRRMSESKLPDYPKINFDTNELSATNITEKLE